MRSRKFWLGAEDIWKTASDSYYHEGWLYEEKRGNCIEFREVLPIDWDNVWAESELLTTNELMPFRLAIQELIDRALKGEI